MIKHQIVLEASPEALLGIVVGGDWVASLVTKVGRDARAAAIAASSGEHPRGLCTLELQ